MERDRQIDLVRGLAIVMVVVGHWLAIHVTHDGGRYQGGSVLELVPWTHPLTWVFQVMPLFFLVGGYANAASLRSHVRRGGNAAGWALGRAVRLVWPTTVLVCVLAAAALTARAAGADPGLVGTAVWLATIPLWFLVAYLAVVFLTPFMYALHRRAGLAVPVGLAAVVGLVDLARLGFGVPYIGTANYLLAWLAVHQTGFVMRDGGLPSRWGIPMAAGGVAALVLLTVPGPYPVSMVGIGGEQNQNTAPPTLALLALAVAQTGIVLATREPARRWLRRPRPWAAVVAVNSVVLTLFLWHMTAAVIGVLLLYGTGALPPAAPVSPLWLALRVPWLATLALILAALVAAFGRFERRAALAGAAVPAVRGPVPTALIVTGAASVVAGLLAVALSGPARDGPLGLPPGVFVYFGGVFLLAALRRRHSLPQAGARAPGEERAG
ncbi:acyltransferase [Sphaerisporangium sp. B11E5]|uniref:acyltransferase family protein n=1 Tax=Sphaerisporangium sp. B11E5 TaxID=3153563 RepID=UPI00325EE6BB